VFTFKPYDDMFGEHFLDDFYFLVVVSLNDIIDPFLAVVCKRRKTMNSLIVCSGTRGLMKNKPGHFNNLQN